MENFDDTFLARWITGETSLEENERFKNHPDYEAYKIIKSSSEYLDFKEFNEVQAFEKLKNKLTEKKNKTSTLYKWIASIAAVTVISLGVLFFSNNTTTYTSLIALQRKVNLPDGSEMVLNALSEAKIATKSWDEHRHVNLKGEAFFKVNKGTKFTVETTMGVVEVLGTKFTVNTVDNDLIIVKCFEGKVKVTVKGSEHLLTKGMAFQQHENTSEQWVFEKELPQWLVSEETSLYKVPVADVITLLKRQHHLTIQQQEYIDSSLIFTGSFSNRDLNKALYSVFRTLDVSYEIVAENEIRILLE